MKHLLTLVLACLLLCGCGQAVIPEEVYVPQAVDATVPSAPEGTYEPGHPLETAHRGSLRVYPLDLRKVRGMKAMGDGMLLLSGYGSTTLTLLTGETLAEAASITLDFELDPMDPSLRITEESLSFYDPEAKDTVVLNTALQELRRIAAPGDLTGQPVLSDDGNTLYYCTASDVRAWDLETGIRRCVKEMSFDSQTITNVLMDGRVLQCSILDGNTERTLFFSSENGQLLCEGQADLCVASSGGRYFASVPAGAIRAMVFGEEGDSARMLVPSVLSSQGFFLPRQEGLVAVSFPDDTQVKFEYYELDTGLRRSLLTLGSYHSPTSIESLGDDTVYILTYDPAEDRDVIYRWDVSAESSLFIQDSTCYASPYYTVLEPDTAGLSRCQTYAAQIGLQHGIEILIWEDAVAAQPWDYDLKAEYLVPVLQRELELLEQRLAQYPEGFLKDTASHFSSLKICLVRQITGTAESGSLETATGLQFLDGTDAYVAIAVGDYSDRALYHELFHVMETRIFSESKAYDQWDELNPAGFKYDYDYAANTLRDSGVYLLSENRAFVDTYSMSFPKEDRARIMEYAMLPGNEELFQAKVMQNKLKTLCEGIRDAYGLQNNEEFYIWEQYLE